MIDIGKPITDEHVTRMDDVRVTEVDLRVAVRVPGARVEDIDHVAVVVESHGLQERDLGQPLFGIRGLGPVGP